MNKSKSIFKWGLRSMALALGGALIAQATAMTLGTKWTIANTTDGTITIACERVDGGDGTAAKLNPTQIPGGQVLEYNWGEAWHNEGMGLNAGRWSCRGGSGDGAEIGTFKTERGEDVSLVVSAANDQLALTKADGKAKVARSRSRGEARVQRN